MVVLADPKVNLPPKARFGAAKAEEALKGFEKGAVAGPNIPAVPGALEGGVDAVDIPCVSHTHNAGLRSFEKL